MKFKAKFTKPEMEKLIAEITGGLNPRQCQAHIAWFSKLPVEIKVQVYIYQNKAFAETKSKMPPSYEPEKLATYFYATLIRGIDAFKKRELGAIRGKDGIDQEALEMKSVRLVLQKMEEIELQERKENTLFALLCDVWFSDICILLKAGKSWRDIAKYLSVHHWGEWDSDGKRAEKLKKAGKPVAFTHSQLSRMWKEVREKKMAAGIMVEDGETKKPKSRGKTGQKKSEVNLDAD